MTTSSPKLCSRPVANTDAPEHTTPQGERALRLLEAAHAELLGALRAHAADARCTVNVNALPRHSRRLLWNLYKVHDPKHAQWMRDVAEARQLMNATLCLNAQDILRFLAIEPADIETEAAALAPP